MRTPEFIKRCLAAGVDLDTALLVAKAFEAEVEIAVEEMLDVQRSKARARQAKHREKVAQEHNGNNVMSRDETSADVNRVKPRDLAPEPARVRELSPRLVISGSDDDVDCANAVSSSDDWPKLTGRQTWASVLVEAVASPWLDPSKSPGLVETAGRVVAWRRDGASWQHDVVPVVTALCVKAGKRVGTWKYFDGSICQAIADNRAALRIPDGRVVPLRPGGESLTDRIAAEHAEARRRVLEG